MSSTTYFVITHEDKYQHTASKDGDPNADGSTITEQNNWPRFKAILVGWGPHSMKIINRDRFLIDYRSCKNKGIFVQCVSKIL